MTKFSPTLLVYIAVLFAFSCSKSAKIDSTEQNLVFKNPPISALASTASPATVAANLEERVRRHEFMQYPELTVELVTRDPQKAAKLVREAGGQVLYDPNLGIGAQIPFLIASLPPSKVVDHAFVESLGLESARLITSSNRIRPTPIAKVQVAQDGSRNHYVPWSEIKIPELRAKRSGEGLGENVTIAVIDTGVDATHPAMENRVVFWADNTQQTRAPLQEVKAEAGKVKLSDSITIDLPAALDPAASLYAAIIDEKALAIQVDEAGRNAPNPGIDLNRNSSKDEKFPVLVGKEKDSGLWVGFVGTQGGGFSTRDLASSIADFNDIRAGRACKGETVPDHNVFVEFPSRTRRIAYPFLIERNQNVPAFVALGIDLMDHGTHVAGIAAGNGLRIEGAAPKANIMSLKVCSGWHCTDEALLRSLVDAFYNPYGCVPDVVNMSIGSHLGKDLSGFDRVFRDLTAKFGTTFFISASNEGPGYRSLNAFGGSGPIAMVGAHISRDSYQRHYNAGPNQNIPEQMMFHFSSLGPSFTGLLRPNFAAPGSALSSVPLASGGSEMMQGTSMSSPIAAGAAAALLSLAKKSPEYEKYGRLRTVKIQSLLQPTNARVAAVSLQQFPLALRASLQETARRMPGYTDAQQGFGLIDVSAAYELFVQKLRKVDTAVFGEYSMNDNKSENSLYDRASDIPAFKNVAFKLIEDDEAPENEMIGLRSTDLNVKLEHVEVQDTTGAVQRLSQNLPFSILSAGDSVQEGTSATLVLSNPVANTVRFLRKLDRMESGKTYVAHYSLSREGQEVQSLLDVVHKPFTFADGTATYDSLPGITVEPIRKTAAFVKAGQEIKSAENHRYPFAITNRDQGFSVKLGIPQGLNGVLYVTVYDPEGKKVGDGGAAVRQPGNNAPIARFYVPTAGKPGIYELTVAASSGRWLSDSKYDLMVVADRLRVSKDKIALASGAAKGTQLPRDTTISVMNSSRQARRLAAEVAEVSQMERLKNVKIEPQSWTFRRIHLPEKKGDTDKTSVTVELGTKLVESAAFSGRIDNHLFVLSADGSEFEPVYTAESENVEAGKKQFKDVKLDGKELFMALESYSFNPGVGEKAEGDIDVAYEDVVPEGADGVTAALTRDSSTDTFLLKVAAPASLGLPIAESAVPVLRGKVLLKPDSSENSEPYSIPFTVSQ